MSAVLHDHVCFSSSMRCTCWHVCKQRPWMYACAGARDTLNWLKAALEIFMMVFRTSPYGTGTYA